ncbi:hypothetical protein OC835_001190 [Tilletia horrida]|uniref:Uncharacterized protein n=1 Tax=Tilletia horrida TaxID=155126 RepID=A0AAN6G8H7_9BASI|nr:hypothetical protein OC842_005839 [Tilletia horrida]KAK0539243.1 hypothetical protein OC835_001190 [Tilletia horrida]
MSTPIAHLVKIADRLARIDEAVKVFSDAVDHSGGRIVPLQDVTATLRQAQAHIRSQLSELDSILADVQARCQKDLDEMRQQTRRDTEELEGRQQRRLDQIFAAAKNNIDAARSRAVADLDAFCSRISSDVQPVDEGFGSDLSKLRDKMKAYTGEAQQETQDALGQIHVVERPATGNQLLCM